MRVNIKPVSVQDFSHNGSSSVKRLKLPTQKESFEQVLAEQIQASVQKKPQNHSKMPQASNTIELQRRTIHLNHVKDGEDVNLDIMDDKSEDLIRRISNQTIKSLIQSGGDYSGGLINTSA